MGNSEREIIVSAAQARKQVADGEIYWLQVSFSKVTKLNSYWLWVSSAIENNVYI